MFIDTHAHISCKELEPHAHEILDRAKKAKLEAIVNVSCSQSDLRPNILWCMEHSTPLLPIYNAIGYHPDTFSEEKQEHTTAAIAELMDWLEKTYALYKDQIVAIGECGLDYYRTFHREAQMDLFREQIKFAQHHSLPVVIHLRGEVWEDFFTILGEYPLLKGVVHCFGGSLEQAQRLLTYPHMFLSFTGIITFKNAVETYRPILEAVPLERVLIETDSPYLAPTPHRGKINEPSYVVEVAKQIALVKNCPLSEVEEITTRNAKELFCLP